jgi:hypothetical protein
MNVSRYRYMSNLLTSLQDGKWHINRHSVQRFQKAVLSKDWLQRYRIDAVSEGFSVAV